MIPRPSHRRLPMGTSDANAESKTSQKMHNTKTTAVQITLETSIMFNSCLSLQNLDSSNGLVKISAS